MYLLKKLFSIFCHAKSFDMMLYTQSKDFLEHDLPFVMCIPGKKRRHGAFAFDRYGNKLAQAQCNNKGCAEKALFRILEEQHIPLKKIAHILVIQGKFIHSSKMDTKTRYIFRCAKDRKWKLHENLNNKVVRKFLAKTSCVGVSKPCSDCAKLLIEKVPNAKVTWSTRIGDFEQCIAADFRHCKNLHVRLRKRLRNKLESQRKLCTLNKRRKTEETIVSIAV